jgi:signal transduction histidine kinase
VSDVTQLLRGVVYFSDLPDDLLDRVCIGVDQIEIAAGEVVLAEGDPADSMYVVVEGELQVTKSSDGREVVLSTVGPGEVQGELALLDETPRTATVTALTEARLIEVPASAFRQLLDEPSFSLAILKTVMKRLRETESAFRHEERMAGLGKMAAQLMHELNNPAAALVRGLSGLEDVNGRIAEVGARLSGTGPLPLPSGSPPDSPLGSSEREDEITTALEKLGVDRAWELAPALVSDGWLAGDLEILASEHGAEEAATIATWIGLISLNNRLLDESRIAGSRISELVRVVKEYSFLDRGPVQEVDVRSGIDDTLVLLGYKLRGVEVTLDYADDLPKIEAPGRDLNQVWTNLIDNAADVLDGAGELVISAAPVDDGVEVVVANTGPPIPSDTIHRIFDPFFTTKEPGKGTGLGLHTVHSIVTRMGGQVTVTSDDGWTRFTVTLPG